MSALSSVAAAFALTPAIAKPLIHESPAEDPRIIELARRIDPLLQSYRLWTAREAEARKIFQRLRPAVPDDLVTAVDKYPDLRDCLVEEGDMYGFREPAQTYVGADGKTYAKRPQRILASKPLRIRIIERDVGRTTRRDRDLRRLARLAMDYERATQTALSESGFPAIEGERSGAAHELEMLAYDLRKLEPKTITGVLIFARALSAFEEAETCAGRMVGGSAQLLGPKLSTAILRIGDRGRIGKHASV